MNSPDPNSDKDKAPDAARHGPRTEVTWDGGTGRQPYENQDADVGSPAAAGEAPAGNRGDASGRHLDQLEKARREP